MRRHRSGEEKIAEPGQEMQDSDDLLAGRLPSKSSLRKSREPASPRVIDPSDGLHASMERLRTSMSPEEFRKLVEAIPSAMPRRSPETSDPMQPAINAVQVWSQPNSELLEAVNQDDLNNSVTEPPSSQDEMVVLTPDLLEASHRLTELFRRQGLVSPAPSEPEQSFLDSNLRIFSEGDESGSYK